MRSQLIICNRAQKLLRAVLRWAALAIAFVCALFGQATNTIVGIGYGIVRVPLPLSPGQVVTLLVRGIKAPDSKAAALPLPLELSGVSVLVEEPSVSYRKQAPILRIDTSPCGNGLKFICDTRAVTIQVPADIPLRGGPGQVPLSPVITILENGIAGFDMEFNLRAADVHIPNDCYIIARAPAPTCAPFVAHANGDVITSDNPARPGEEIVLYAFGLGPTSPSVPEGVAAPNPAPRTTVDLRLNFRATVPESNFFSDTATWPRPTYAGLVPGFAGLYQVNFRIPDTLPPGISECQSAFSRNLTVILFAPGTSDFTQICVRP